MAHYPLNHHLRQTYRFLAGLAGLYLLVAGIIGIATTWDDGGNNWILGQRLNPVGAWLYAIVGLVLVAAVLIGGNIYHLVALFLGWGLCGLGVLVMAVLQTDANVLNASMTNIITVIVLGLIVLAAGLYGKVGSHDDARAESAAASAR